MSLTTILLMVLGVAVVVFLIWGFSTQWKMFQGVVSPFTSGNNVDQVKQACSLACSSESVNGFCNSTKSVSFGDSGKNLTMSCDDLANSPLVKTTKGEDASISVETCPGLC